MIALEIDVQSAAGVEADDPRAIAIRAGNVVFTRLMRRDGTESDEYLKAPPAQLAFWLADNWWRLRWEGIPPAGMTPNWRLAHELSSIGSGYVWPRLAIWGEEERIMLSARCDPAGVVGPVRYLTDALLFVPARQYEETVDRFFEAAAADTGYGSDRATLRGVVEALKAERADPETAAWRRMEARLGFDPDHAPDALMEAVAALAERYGPASVEEAAMAAPGVEAAEILEREIAAAKQSGLVCDFSQAIDATGPLLRTPNDLPWVAAEEMAGKVRRETNIGSGPLRNKKLGDLLGVNKAAFHSVTAPSGDRLPYGLRLKPEGKSADVITLRSRSSHDRRFELARAFGDAIWSHSDALGPLARSKTARQKFQRAFAQSFLCPHDDLLAYVNTDHPDEEDISAAAQHFHVSEWVIWTVLVNKKYIERERFEETILDPACLDGDVGTRAPPDYRIDAA